MKRKLLALVTLMLCAVTGAWAQDVYKIQFNGANKEIKNGVEQSELSFFSYNSAKHSFNTKFNGCTYDGVTYTSGLKMESATNVSWTSTAKSNVIIVQSTWNANTIKFDGTELAVSDASTSVTGCRIYTISDVEKGEHSVTRGSGESGIFAITVEYTETALPQLDAPTISDLSETGNKVTISYPTNASSVVYTLDGSDPSADNGTAISATTDVTITEDGTTVKAIAIGDGTTYANSQIASKVIYLPGIKVATPVVEVINGTMAITCETANATILYSLDGTTFQEYTKPVTFFEDTNVTVKATRSGCTDSDGAVVVVEGAPAATEGSKTKVLSFMSPEENEDWEWMEADGKDYGIKGKANTNEDGWSLWISPNSSNVYDKTLSGAGYYNIDETPYYYLKNSNGRQFNIGLPEGVKANRITIYSYNNGGITGTSLWDLVGDESYDADSEIPLQATAEDSENAPDIRVFALNDIEENITLKNNGVIQQCFIAVVDYTDNTEGGIPGPKDPENSIVVATISKATGTLSDNTWTMTDNSDYTFSSSSLTWKSGTDDFKIAKGGTYTIGVPSDVQVTKVEICGYSSNTSEGTTITLGTQSYLFKTDEAYIFKPTHTAGADISFTTSNNKEMEISYIKLYANVGQTLTTTSNMGGWRAFYDEDYNYTLDANTKAYVATEVAQDETEPTYAKYDVVLEPISAVPAGMAVLLKTTNKLDDGTYSMELTEAESVPTPNVTNLLKAAKEAENTDVYRLGYNINAGVAFFPYTIDTAKPDDVVVLDWDASNQARQLTIRISDGSETTAIKSVDVNVSANKTVYDLQGRRVTQPSKGLYIVNGKKVIIK